MLCCTPLDIPNVRQAPCCDKEVLRIFARSGFVTSQEIADILGDPVDEIEIALSVDPTIFGGKVLRRHETPLAS